MLPKNGHIASEPAWYKDAVIYELHVKTFRDSDGDGVGDFKGLCEKLDYLKDLGVTAVWLLPFYPSPLRDDGYDIADYYGIHPSYGTLADFKKFLDESHKRGIRVITELVINHTSERHPWFQKARRAKPSSAWRDFYVWSDTPEKYKDARVIFKDFETSNWTWDAEARAYYWHRFYSHQPDLNFDNPRVREEIFRVIDYWLAMGVDGMRLDAVPYLFERDGTNCENLPETHEFLKSLRAHVDRKYPGRMLLAEANQWPEDAVAYFADGDECHMAFHFPLMPRMFMSMWMEDRFPITDIFEQTPPIPGSSQWALFLRNHDELTLEMVTDEERDYMYSVYARDPGARINLGIRRRLAPLLGNHRRKMELMNIMLFSLPGTPVIYYGDEIAMGDNYYLGDRNGVRTPMQWNADRNAGFSRANPQKLYLPVIIDPEYHYESVNVENGSRNQSSFLWWMKRVIAMRKKLAAFGRGEIEFIPSENPKILAFSRKFGGETILVVINLSRFSQTAELDLSKYAGAAPVEVFGGCEFPAIKETPYVFTMGFYDYFWFSLKKKTGETDDGARAAARTLRTAGDWTDIFRTDIKEKFEREILCPYIARQRWFRSKTKKIRAVDIAEIFPVPAMPSARIIFATVSYYEGAAETYNLPLAYASGETAAKIFAENSDAVLARLETGRGDGIIFDALHSDEFRLKFAKALMKRSSLDGRGKIRAAGGKLLRNLNDASIGEHKTALIKSEQSNSSFIYDDSVVFKIYRKIEEGGAGPDIEMSRFLTEKSSFANTPPFIGAFEYSGRSHEKSAVAAAHGFVKNQGDAWGYALDSLGRYYERAFASGDENGGGEAALIGTDYLAMVGLLAKRTAQMHLALAAEMGTPAFAPEPFSMLYQRSLFQSMQGLNKKVFLALKKKIASLDGTAAELAKNAADLEKSAAARFRTILRRKFSAVKTRIHGDYHLGQVLFTGNDFYIIDFEGEPMRPLGERMLKRSPLRDVAGMLRSFHYAAYSALLSNQAYKPENFSSVSKWAKLWGRASSEAFMNSYLETAGPATFIPPDKVETAEMLDIFVLEKAIYELGYELNNRPGWAIIPLVGISDYLGITK